MTAYMGNNVSAGGKSKRSFGTTHESAQKHPVRTAKPRIGDDVLSSHPKLQHLSLPQDLLLEKLSSLLCQHLKLSKCTPAL